MKTTSIENVNEHAAARLAEMLRFRSIGQKRAGKCDAGDYRRAIADRDALYPGCRIPLPEFYAARSAADVLQVVLEEISKPQEPKQKQETIEELRSRMERVSRGFHAYPNRTARSSSGTKS